MHSCVRNLFPSAQAPKSDMKIPSLRVAEVATGHQGFDILPFRTYETVRVQNTVLLALHVRLFECRKHKLLNFGG